MMQRKKTPTLHRNSALKNEIVQIFGAGGKIAIAIKEILIGMGFNKIYINDTISSNSIGVAIITGKAGDHIYPLLSEIKIKSPETPVIVISETINTIFIVDVIKRGAENIFTTPLDHQQLFNAIVAAFERKVLMNALSSVVPERKLQKPEAFKHIITQDFKILSLFRYIEEVANTAHPVLITGETGVGKELIAKAISLVKGASDFISLNIAGVDDMVFSDTLFGHKKGAYTGADSPREGLIVKAKDGVLLLDEIGDLTDTNQIKLLRLIQEGEYYPLGADTPNSFTAKLVVATNIDLEKAVADGTFRKDLFYRITTHRIHIPPLRERLGDLPILVSYLVEKSAYKLGKKPPKIAPELINLLNCYSFPGNIRELEAMVNDAVSLHKKGILSMASFEKKIRLSRDSNQKNQQDLAGANITFDFPEFPSIKEMEDHLVDVAMIKANGNQGVAAGLLGISRQALNKRILSKTKIKPS